MFQVQDAANDSRTWVLPPPPDFWGCVTILS